MLRMESRGLDTGHNAPLFVNRQGKPMTVQTYSERIKMLFYERFLPSLKQMCEAQGIYGDYSAFIETYESEYPGAHMFVKPFLNKFVGDLVKKESPTPVFSGAGDSESLFLKRKEAAAG